MNQGWTIVFFTLVGFVLPLIGEPDSGKVPNQFREFRERLERAARKIEDEQVAQSAGPLDSLIRQETSRLKEWDQGATRPIQSLDLHPVGGRLSQLVQEHLRKTRQSNAQGKPTAQEIEDFLKIHNQWRAEQQLNEDELGALMIMLRQENDGRRLEALGQPFNPVENLKKMALRELKGLEQEGGNPVVPLPKALTEKLKTAFGPNAPEGFTASQIRELVDPKLSSEPGTKEPLPLSTEELTTIAAEARALGLKNRADFPKERVAEAARDIGARMKAEGRGGEVPGELADIGAKDGLKLEDPSEKRSSISTPPEIHGDNDPGLAATPNIADPAAGHPQGGSRPAQSNGRAPSPPGILPPGSSGAFPSVAGAGNISPIPTKEADLKGDEAELLKTRDAGVPNHEMTIFFAGQRGQAAHCGGTFVDPTRKPRPSPTGTPGECRVSYLTARHCVSGGPIARLFIRGLGEVRRAIVVPQEATASIQNSDGALIHMDVPCERANQLTISAPLNPDDIKASNSRLPVLLALNGQVNVNKQTSKTKGTLVAETFSVGKDGFLGINLQSQLNQENNGILRGIRPGDSGSPAYVRGEDGKLFVVGALSSGVFFNGSSQAHVGQIASGSLLDFVNQQFSGASPQALRPLTAPSLASAQNPASGIVFERPTHQ